MTVRIRPADLESDADAIVTLLATHLNPAYDRRRFEWLYRQPPAGPARAWVAETADGEIVGTSAAIPREFYVGDRSVTGFVLADFCIAPAYRALGLALQLQRASFSVADTATAGFCYDFPSKSMMAVYTRLGLSPVTEIVRLTRPLGMTAMLLSPQLPHLFWTAAGRLLTAAGAGRSDTVTIALHDGPLGSEFSMLSAEVGGHYGACVRRTADYLTWRYMTHPCQPCSMLTARAAGALRGYAVFTLDRDTATLLDLFGTDDHRLITALVDAVVAKTRDLGARRVDAPLARGHRWLPLLRRRGFRPRDAAPMVTYPSRAAGNPTGVHGLDWLVLHGDRDA
jgi:GNAT superfamily N-acetyltransferase